MHYANVYVNFLFFYDIFLLSVLVIFSSILFAMDSSDDLEIEGVEAISPIKKNTRGYFLYFFKKIFTTI